MRQWQYKIMEASETYWFLWKHFSSLDARSLKRRLLLAKSLSKYGECRAIVDRYHDGNNRKYAHAFVVLCFLVLIKLLPLWFKSIHLPKLARYERPEASKINHKGYGCNRLILNRNSKQQTLSHVYNSIIVSHERKGLSNQSSATWLFGQQLVYAKNNQNPMVSIMRKVCSRYAIIISRDVNCIPGLILCFRQPMRDGVIK